MKKTIYLSLILCVFVFALQSFTLKNINTPPNIVSSSLSNCIASENLDMKCETFISKCRKGSIRSVFPGQFYDKKIKVVKNGKSKAHKTAWKLLNDKRFKK